MISEKETSKMKRITISIMVAAVIAAASVFAQDDKANAPAIEEQEEQKEMTVTADSAEVRLDADNHPAAIELEGNVIIEDISMRLTAKKMTVHLDKDNKPSNIEAVGGVTVRKLDGSGSATGDTGTYIAEDDKVTLKGNCVILQGKNTIKGEQVVYDRKTGVIRLLGASIVLPIKKGSGAEALGNLIKGDKDKNEKENDKTANEKETEKSEKDRKTE